MRSWQQSGSRWSVLRRHIAGWFPERQIHIRTDGRLRYLTLRRRAQVGILGLVAAMAGWLGLSTLGYLRHDAEMAARDRQIATERTAYSILLEDVAGYERKIKGIARELEDNQDLMLELVEQNTALQRSLSVMKDQLRTSEAQVEKGDQARQRLRAEIGRIEAELAAASARGLALEADVAAAGARLADAVEERDRAIAERRAAGGRIRALEEDMADLQQARLGAELRLIEDTRALQEEIAGLRTALQQAQGEKRKAAALASERNGRIAELEIGLDRMRRERQVALDRGQEKQDAFQQQLDAQQRSLTAALNERDEAVRARERKAEEVKGLEVRLASLQAAQEDVINRMIEHTVTQIDSMEKVVGLTGLELDGLLADSGADDAAQGGPFFAAAKPEGVPGAGLRASLVALDQHMTHWETLRDVMQRIPIAAPLGSYQITSSFGKRRDPLNDRWAMHYGVDLGGPKKSEVHVTAPGRVVHAGWMGGYGRMVEIDHGAGLHTRYGHLSKVSVTEGQELSFNDPIGLLGTSGRSSGPHLHYEVIFNGKPMDPMKFIKAGQYVFQSEQDRQ